MSPLRTPMLTSLVLVLAACGDPAAEVGEATGEEASGMVTAATLGEQVVLPTADYLKLPQYQGADTEYGRNLALQCRTCHSLDGAASSPLGPSLSGLFGRRAGSLGDYSYSPPLAEADFVWTPRAVDAWLAAPWRFLPGNRMAYAGLQDQEARNALIAVLLRATEPKATAEGA